MHKGYYCHKTSSSLYGGITVEVIFDHLNVINRVNIEGRIDLDPSQYSKAFEDFQERQEGSFLQHCHIVSVELAKNYIEKCFKNRDFSNLFQNQISDEENPYNAVAKFIYKEFIKTDGIYNRFNDKSYENEGQSELRNLLRTHVKKGESKFSAPELKLNSIEHQQILLFIQQDPDLKNRMTAENELVIHNWNELLFVYEHCLIDYRVLSQVTNKEKYAEWIAKGQEMFDELYGNATHALRYGSECASIVSKREEERSWQRNYLQTFLVKRNN